MCKQKLIHNHGISHSLNVDVGTIGSMENVGDKVVLHSGVDLDDVSSLAAHVQVVDGGTFLNVLRPGTDCERMRPDI